MNHLNCGRLFVCVTQFIIGHRAKFHSKLIVEHNQIIKQICF